MSLVFSIAWQIFIYGLIIHDAHKPSLKGPFNETTIRPGCHWRVEYGTASDGMPYSAVWRDVLCSDRAGQLQRIP